MGNFHARHRLGLMTAAWAKSGVPLPYDAEVEWFESVPIATMIGGQYRQNGFLLSDAFGNDTGFEVEVARLVENTSDLVAVGSRDASGGDNRYFVGGTVNRLWYFGYGTRIDYGNCVVGQKVKLSLNMYNTREARFNGELAGVFSFFRGNNMPFAFPGYNAGDPELIPTKGPATSAFAGFIAAYKYYSLKVSKGTTLTHDLIPVRVGLELRLYNKVNSELLNPIIADPTYSFVIGPDKTT